MNGLNQIRTTVAQTLADAGLTAAPAWDGAAAEADRPVISVEVAETSGKPMAFGSYLGEKTDESGNVREIYGRELETVLALDVRAPTAAACETTAEQSSDALSSRLPAGLKLREENWAAISWDSVNRCFLRRGELKCSAYFVAEMSADTGTLLDFVLKGVLTS